MDKTITNLALQEIHNNNQIAKNKAKDNFNFAMQNKNFALNYNNARSLQFELAKLEFENKDTKKIKGSFKIQLFFFCCFNSANSFIKIN